MKLRNRKSYMTSLPEGEPPKNNKASITQLIYFLILLIVVGYLFFLITKRYWYFEEIGVVEVEKTLISSIDGGRIDNIYIKEGQKLKMGDSIAVIEASRTDCTVTQDSRIDKLRYEIQNDIVELGVLRAQLAATKQTTDDYELRRALELDRGLLRESERIKREQEKYSIDITLLSKQIELKKQQLNDLQKNKNTVSMHRECFSESIVAPFNAIVLAIHKRPKEYTQRGEAIVTLIKHGALVRIEAYLNRDLLKYIHIGDKLDIEFPDGMKSHGLIKEINSSAYIATERQLDQYKPYESDIRVHLMPIDNQMRDQWLKYDRMEVSVKGRK